MNCWEDKRLRLCEWHTTHTRTKPTWGVVLLICLRRIVSLHHIHHSSLVINMANKISHTIGELISVGLISQRYVYCNTPTRYTQSLVQRKYSVFPLSMNGIPINKRYVLTTPCNRYLFDACLHNIERHLWHFPHQSSIETNSHPAVRFACATETLIGNFI